MERTVAGNSRSSYGRSSAWSFKTNYKREIRYWYWIQSRWYCVSWNNSRTCWGCRTLWAVKALCRSAFTYGADRKRQRYAVCGKLQRGQSWPQLATTYSHPSKRKSTYRCSDRLTDYRYEDNTYRRTRTPKTYGGRRLPSGNLSCGTSRLENGWKCFAWAVVRISSWNTYRKRRTCNDRHSANGRYIQSTRNNRWYDANFRLCTRCDNAWLSNGRNRLHAR